MEILKICQSDGQRASMFNIFCTQVFGLRVNILVNVAICPAILSCSRSKIYYNFSIGKKWCWGDDTKKHWRLLICLRVTGDIPKKLRRNIVCNRQDCSMPQPKIARFSMKMCASQQRAWMLTIFYPQVLGLRVVNFETYPAILLCSRSQKNR